MLQDAGRRRETRLCCLPPSQGSTGTLSRRARELWGAVPSAVLPLFFPTDMFGCCHAPALPPELTAGCASQDTAPLSVCPSPTALLYTLVSHFAKEKADEPHVGF